MSSCLDSINHERSQGVGSDESWPHTGEERDTGWRVYNLACIRERDELVRDIVTLVKENEPPARQRRTKRGRKRVHSWKKLVCMYMPADGYTWLYLQGHAERNCFYEPAMVWWTVAYHPTIHRAYQEIPKEYLDTMLERVASLPLHQRGREGGRKEY